MIKVTVVNRPDFQISGPGLSEDQAFIDPDSVSCLVELQDGYTKIYFNNHTIIVKESLEILKKQAPSLFY